MTLTLYGPPIHLGCSPKLTCETQPGPLTLYPAWRQHGRRQGPCHLLRIGRYDGKCHTTTCERPFVSILLVLNSYRRPGFHPTTEDIRARKLIKSIGDEPSRPNTQVVGTYASESLPDDVDMFTKLAKAYVFEGQDRQTLCEMNARVRFPRLHVKALLKSPAGRFRSWESSSSTDVAIACILFNFPCPRVTPDPPTISASAHAERIAGVGICARRNSEQLLLPSCSE